MWWHLVDNRHGKAEACWDFGLIKCNPVSPSFAAETHKPKSPKSSKFAAIFISLITVSGSLYLRAWELFTALSHLCARCQRIIKTWVRRSGLWGEGERPRSLGQWLCSWPFFTSLQRRVNSSKLKGQQAGKALRPEASRTRSDWKKAAKGACGGRPGYVTRSCHQPKDFFSSC